MKERVVETRQSGMSGKGFVIRMEWLVTFLTKDDCDLDSLITKPNFFMWLAAYKHNDLTVKMYKQALAHLSKCKSQGGNKDVNDILKQTLRKRLPSKSKRWAFEDEIPPKHREVLANSKQNQRLALNVEGRNEEARLKPVRRRVAPVGIAPSLMIHPPMPKVDLVDKRQPYHDNEMQNRVPNKGAPLPRGWLQPEWLYDFSKVKGKLTTDVLDSPRFFLWLKQHKFPDLTKSQYRTSIRRLVDDMGPGYDNNKINKIDKGLSSVLREKIKEYGKKAWGFQKKLKKEPAKKGSAWEGKDPYVQALPSRKRGRSHSAEYYVPCEIPEDSKRHRAADKYLYPQLPYPRAFPVPAHAVEPQFIRGSGNVQAPVYAKQTDRSSEYSRVKIPLATAPEDYPPYPPYHYPMVPRGHYPEPVHTTEAFRHYPYE